MKYKGTILKESLESFDCLNQINIVNQEEWFPQNHTDFQPEKWTAIFFENNDENISNVVKTLSLCIKEKWYIDISAENSKYIIFRNKIFKYNYSDKTGKEEALEYGKLAGIPESQLDWPD